MINRILAIRKKRTVLTTEYINQSSSSCNGFHESLLQAFDIVEYIKDYLGSHEKVDCRILLEIIEAMQFTPREGSER